MGAGAADARIALDVMGGDTAPDDALRGALRACSQDAENALPPERVLLVGDEERIRTGLAELGGDPGFAVQHASQVIEMDEKPAQALRAKPDSSIGRCVLAVREKQAGAVVSMGNTGAVVGASTLGLGTLEGIKRPGIAVTLDLTGHPCTLIDMGANISPKPLHLRQYGRMGAEYTKACLGTENPRVGLLNIGAESSKGTDLLKEAHQLLAESDLNFVGNVEGTDVFLNKADVVVADGFTGNVVLKLLEGFSGFMLHLIMAELKRHDVQWSADALSNVRRNIDYAEYGGALLLGVAGIVVIGHGKSDGGAFANALGCAARALDADVNEHIVAGVRSQAAAG
jgi:glycerol-3-phosphate acyltransferase PlsX